MSPFSFGRMRLSIRSGGTDHKETAKSPAFCKSSSSAIDVMVNDGAERRAELLGSTLNFQSALLSGGR